MVVVMLGLKKQACSPLQESGQTVTELPLLQEHAGYLALTDASQQLASLAAHLAVTASAVPVKHDLNALEDLADFEDLEDFDDLVGLADFEALS